MKTKKAVAVSVVCALLLAGVASATVTDVHLYRMGEIDGAGGTAVSEPAGVSGNNYGQGTSVGAIKDSVGANNLTAYIMPNSTSAANLAMARPFYQSAQAGDVAPLGGNGIYGTRVQSTVSLQFKQAPGVWSSGWQSNQKGSSAFGSLPPFAIGSVPTGIEAWCRPGARALNMGYADEALTQAQRDNILATGFYGGELAAGVRMDLIALKSANSTDSNKDPLAIFTKNNTWWMSVGGSGASGIGVLVDSGVAVDWNNWQHMAAVYENGVAKLYKNGELINTTNKVALLGNTFTMAVGGGHLYNASSTGGDVFCSFMGYVDEARMFTFDSGEFNAATDLNYIPEPATLLLLGLGSLAAVRFRRA